MQEVQVSSRKRKHLNPEHHNVQHHCDHTAEQTDAFIKEMSAYSRIFALQQCLSPQIFRVVKKRKQAGSSSSSSLRQFAPVCMSANANLLDANFQTTKQIMTWVEQQHDVWKLGVRHANRPSILVLCGQHGSGKTHYRTHCLEPNFECVEFPIELRASMMTSVRTTLFRSESRTSHNKPPMVILADVENDIDGLLPEILLDIAKRRNVSLPVFVLEVTNEFAYQTKCFQSKSLAACLKDQTEHVKWIDLRVNHAHVTERLRQLLGDQLCSDAVFNRLIEDSHMDLRQLEMRVLHCQDTDNWNDPVLSDAEASEEFRFANVFVMIDMLLKRQTSPLTLEEEAGILRERTGFQLLNFAKRVLGFLFSRITDTTMAVSTTSKKRKTSSETNNTSKDQFWVRWIQDPAFRLQEIQQTKEQQQQPKTEPRHETLDLEASLLDSYSEMLDSSSSLDESNGFHGDVEDTIAWHDMMESELGLRHVRKVVTTYSFDPPQAKDAVSWFFR